MAEPLPRAIPAPGDSLTRLVSCSLNNFLALFVLPFTLIDWNAYPPFEQPSRNERGIQHYHSPIPSIQVTGGKGNLINKAVSLGAFLLLRNIGQTYQDVLSLSSSCQTEVSLYHKIINCLYSLLSRRAHAEC